jgi:hypothetical protein
MKSEHERRIELVTGIHPSRRSTIVLYGANVGEYSAPVNFTDAAVALFHRRYPADHRGIELGMVNSAFQDRDEEFWSVESRNLTDQVDRKVRERLSSGEASHLSIFALAPQPLLVLLGALISDIPRADVYQLHREPAGWVWPARARTTVKFEVQEPEGSAGTPCLVLSISATVTPDRILSVAGTGASIWTVAIPSPHNDCMKSRTQLAEFRSLMRSLLDPIKARHGQNTLLHVFPAMPLSIAVELGRIRMPKADMPWVIYDQVSQRGGFVPAISLPFQGAS